MFVINIEKWEIMKLCVVKVYNISFVNKFVIVVVVVCIVMF